MPMAMSAMPSPVSKEVIRRSCRAAPCKARSRRKRNRHVVRLLLFPAARDRGATPPHAVTARAALAAPRPFSAPLTRSSAGARVRPAGARKRTRASPSGAARVQEVRWRAAVTARTGSDADHLRELAHGGGRLHQRRVLFVGELDLDDLLGAALAGLDRHAEVLVAPPVLALQDGRPRQDLLLILEDGLDHLGGRGARRIPGA